MAVPVGIGDRGQVMHEKHDGLFLSIFFVELFGFFGIGATIGTH